MQAETTIHEKCDVPVYISEIPLMTINQKPELEAKSTIFNTRIKTTQTRGVKTIPVSTEYKKYSYKQILDEGDGYNLTELDQKKN